MATSISIEQIKKDEGIRPKGYLDEKGILTIGIGFNLTRDDAKEMLIDSGVSPVDVDKIMKVNGKALTEDQIDTLFQMSLLQAEAGAVNSVNNWDEIPQSVKDTLVNMSFQLGRKGLLSFKDMRQSIEKEDWDGMKEEMLDSQWAKKDSPGRAKRLVGQLGDLPATEKVSPPKPLNSKQAHRAGKRAILSQELGALLTKDNTVKELGGLLSKSMEEEEAVEEAPARPKIQRLEQGLFESEDGKRFFVNDKNQMLELGEDNKPIMVIDPTQFDLGEV